MSLTRTTLVVMGPLPVVPSGSLVAALTVAEVLSATAAGWLAARRRRGDLVLIVHTLQAHVALAHGWSLDAWLRHVGEVRANRAFAIDIPSYTTLDLRLVWQLTPRMELSLVGQNLLDPQHPEFVQEALVAPAEIERRVVARLRVEF